MLSCRELVDETTADPELIGPGQKLRWPIRLHLMMCRHCRRYTRRCCNYCRGYPIDSRRPQGQDL